MSRPKRTRNKTQPKIPKHQSYSFSFLFHLSSFLSHLTSTMALASSLRRLPLLSKTHFLRSTSSSVPASRSAKVSDRIVRLFAVDLDGKKREVVGLTGQTLLRALTNAGLIDPASHRMEEIEACSAECEVHVAQEWLDKMPEPTYEERYVLTRASRNRELNKHARLGCQVVLAPEHEDMVVAIPEPKPWDIP
ncbi:hypothetical protein LUZ60_001957 [Juncus effusus]|nr:hypothetical protein LUZ60_001957 [Juncus effusus]